MLLAVAASAQPPVPMGPEEARHLLLRTSFHAAPGEVRALAGLTRSEAVDWLLDGVQTAPSTHPSPELDRWTPRSEQRAMSPQDRRARLRHTIEQGQALRGWWFGEMLATPSPFTERMTLFWHNHFVSSLRKVRPTRLMYRQNLLLRRHALGSFRDMLHAVARDPAMILYLDNASNRKGKPNENFAREVMELFTLGEGNYSEQDVKEAARAFTGWGIDGESGAFRFRSGLHDAGVKTILGRSGAFDGDEVLDILLAQPQTAEAIVRKLWREFVSPDPDPDEIRRVADVFRRTGYDIRAAMRALLTSEAFFAEANRATLVKSPVELLVGTLRQFRFDVGDVYPFVVISRQLGQDLMAPPNVKGWPGGDAWINAGTLLARKQIMARLFRNGERSTSAAPAAMAGNSMTGNAMAGNTNANAMAGPAPTRYQKAMRSVRFDPARWAAQLERGTADEIEAAMLPARPLNPVTRAPDQLALVRQLALDPVYQLK
ncbi:MAG: DUF1800 domain-containing protein [Burkholderiales bacterium]